LTFAVGCTPTCREFSDVEELQAPLRKQKNTASRTFLVFFPSAYTTGCAGQIDVQAWMGEQV
jgi:hypothetical protein